MMDRTMLLEQVRRTHTFAAGHLLMSAPKHFDNPLGDT